MTTAKIGENWGMFPLLTGEVAVARAAAARGTAMGLSSFASKPIEEVVAANPQTFLQMYWVGTHDMAARMERARKAGAVGIIVTLDWSFSFGRDWGSPRIPEKMTLQEMMRQAPAVVTRPSYLYSWLRNGIVPDLTVPNLPVGGAPAPTFFGPTGSGWAPPRPPSGCCPTSPGLSATRSRSCSTAGCGAAAMSADRCD